ncbi:glycoside hydrolase family 18 protein [Candidatus Bathyarchaeota archaeon]|nr:glycoside hydrolase family 18 protein [Candidatus Bathyarchaeota archaeon]
MSNTKRADPPSHLTDAWADTDIHWENDSWNDEGTNLYGCLKQLNLLKKRNRNLNVLLSIGGWTFSPNFAGPCSTPQGRQRFADTAVELVKNLGFDGLDIDWEYPENSSQAKDYVDLLKACRKALDAYGGDHHFELTVACPAGTEQLKKLDIKGMDKYLDFWNLMAYDFAGSWDQTTAHQANLYPSSDKPESTPFSAVGALDYYIKKGVAPSKMVVGMPLYGRAFENTAGPGSPFQGVGQGTWEQGIYDYKNLPLPGSQEVDDAQLGASYCFDPASRTFVTYDSVCTALKKAEFIKSQGLGGAMWWESSSDKAGDQSIITNVVHGFGGCDALMKCENCVRYPQSKYDNVRRGLSEA